MHFSHATTIASSACVRLTKANLWITPYVFLGIATTTSGLANFCLCAGRLIRGHTDVVCEFMFVTVSHWTSLLHAPWADAMRVRTSIITLSSDRANIIIQRILICIDTTSDPNSARRQHTSRKIRLFNSLYFFFSTTSQQLILYYFSWRISTSLIEYFV